MTSDADGEGSSVPALEGRAYRAVLSSPERGAAREGRILRHVLLERRALVRLKAVVHVGVKIRQARGLHYFTTRKCGTAARGTAAGCGRVNTATRSRALVSRVIRVASEISSAAAASL